MAKDKTMYAAGAPRAHQHGRVYLFNYIKGVADMNIDLILEGELIASNFGYEIASVDINGDG